MRIAITGAPLRGKTQLANSIVQNWPVYKLATQTHTDLLDLPLNQDKQWKILNKMVDDIQQTTKKDNVVFDTCPLDNIIHSIRLQERGESDIDWEFVKKCIPVVKESMRAFDMIFFLPITKAGGDNIDDLQIDDAKKVEIIEVDNFLKGVSNIFKYEGTESIPFFVHDDAPAIIEIFGQPHERIELIKYYIDERGELIGGDVKSASQLFDGQNLQVMEELLRQQKAEAETEKQRKRLEREFRSNLKGK